MNFRVVVALPLLLTGMVAHAQTKPHPTSGLFQPAAVAKPVGARPANAPIATQQARPGSAVVRAIQAPAAAPVAGNFPPITIVQTATFQAVPAGPMPIFPVLAAPVKPVIPPRQAVIRTAPIALPRGPLPGGARPAVAPTKQK